MGAQSNENIEKQRLDILMHPHIGFVAQCQGHEAGKSHFQAPSMHGGLFSKEKWEHHIISTTALSVPWIHVHICLRGLIVISISWISIIPIHLISRNKVDSFQMNIEDANEEEEVARPYVPTLSLYDLFGNHGIVEKRSRMARYRLPSKH